MSMIKVYDVQTFYGTEAKTFQSLAHAERYWQQLKKSHECVDPIITRKVTEKDFVYENLED